MRVLCSHLEPVLWRGVARSISGSVPVPLAVHQPQRRRQVSSLVSLGSASDPEPAQLMGPVWFVCSQDPLPRLPGPALERHAGCQRRKEGEGLPGLPRVRPTPFQARSPPSPPSLTSATLVFFFSITFKIHRGHPRLPALLPVTHKAPQGHHRPPGPGGEGVRGRLGRRHAGRLGGGERGWC